MMLRPAQFMDSEPPLVNRFLPFLLALLMALFSGGLAHARMLQIGQPSSFLQFFLDHLFSWSFWAAVFFLAGHLALRWDIRIQDGRTGRFIRHLVVAVVIVGVKVAASVTVSMLLFGESMANDRLLRQVNAELFWKGPLELFTYSALLAIVYALLNRRELARQQATAAKLETQLALSQLENLQRQLHPHFLFNSLNAISVLISQGDSARASRMLERLCLLLRRVMTLQPDQEVPLSEELTFVDAYLEIEQIRFGDRLQIRREFAPDTSTLLVPAFALQGLVENAVRHGIARTAGPGFISLYAACADGMLQIDIVNSGGDESTDGSGHGVGLANLRGRLATRYGATAQLSLQHESAGVVRCRLQLPVTRAGESGK